MIKENYDIIVSYLEGPTTRIVSGCTNTNTKLINWVHTEMNNISEFQKSYRSAKEMKKAYERYNVTIFVAKTTESSFKEKTKIKLKNSKVIRNIIDINEILSKSNEKIENEKEQITLVTLARLTQSKGYERLLKIHKRLLDEKIYNRLWILGEGEDRSKIENYIKQNSLENTVKLYGYQENPYKYLKQADIYVCASYIEGYSTAVTEALIVGKPIVTTNCSGMSEILENGKYGLIVENNDEDLYEGIKEMILNSTLRKKFENLAIERRTYFDIKNKVKELDELFENS